MRQSPALSQCDGFVATQHISGQYRLGGLTANLLANGHGGGDMTFLGARRLALLGNSLAFVLLAGSVAHADGPHYANDSSWPKPFAHHWVNGQIGGLEGD